MNLRKPNFKRLLFFTILIVLFNSAVYYLFSLQDKAYADAPKISKESVDFLTKIGQAMSEISNAVKPAIVNISTTKTEKLSESPYAPFFDDPFFRRFFGDRFRHPEVPRERKTASLGSGVIVSSNGYILTNSHVIKDADEIKVLLSDKREFQGKIIGTDPKTEVAVIKIDAQDLPTISWGDSDKLKVGEVVMAIGSPFGLNQTVTMGIVSAVGRANVGIADYEDFIQTDAAINPGNSGGALVNARGELVGINTAIFSTTGGYQGIGFAIPSNMAKAVMDSLIKTGKVIRGWLGVSIQPLTPELAKQFNLEKEYGALVGDVIENSPAEKAGILRGDVIIEYNGKKVNEPYHLRNTVANTPPGETAELKVIRNGKIETIKVMIGELPTEVPKAPVIEYKNVLRGISVRELTPELYRQMNISEKIKGVIVAEIGPDSPAEGKLMEDDIIQEINRKAISNLKDYESTASEIKPDEIVLLLVFRKGSSVFITISP
ncbi:MAG: DegQ family serine endoprotease [Nitrospirota bacterium]